MGPAVGSDSKESACNAGIQVQSLGWEDPLEKGMATHSSILAWRIPWTEDPGGYSPWCYKELGTTEGTNTSLSFVTNDCSLGQNHNVYICGTLTSTEIFL